MHVTCVCLQMTAQYILSMIFFPLCMMGCVFAGTGGLSTSYFSDPNPNEKQVKAIAATIIVGCLGCLAVNIFGMCLICTYGRYFGVHINQRRGGATVVVINQGNTGAGVYTTQSMGYNNFTANNPTGTQLSSLQEQNRLLQMQIQLQQQQLQQQQQYPPQPPAYGMDPAYPPTAPPAYGAL